MRKDMNKVTTERERYNSRSGNPEVYRARKASSFYLSQLSFDEEENEYDIDTPPRNKGVGNPSFRSSYAHKTFSDVLNPLKGWLAKQVGKKWDDVYSEACQTMSRDTVSGNHVFEHLLQYVELHTCVVDGVLYSRNRQKYPLTSGRRYPTYWVDENGLLQKAPMEVRRERYDHDRGMHPHVILDGVTVIAQHDSGAWFKIWSDKSINPNLPSTYSFWERKTYSPFKVFHWMLHLDKHKLNYPNYNEFFKSLETGSIKWKTISKKEMRDYGIIK